MLGGNINVELDMLTSIFGKVSYPQFEIKVNEIIASSPRPEKH